MKNKIFLMALSLILLAMPLSFADITTGLVGYYKFEQNLLDSSGYGNHGTQVGDISYPTGIHGYGMHTDNAYSAVNIGNDTSLQILGNLTISMWIYPNTTSCGTWLISKSIWYGDYGEYAVHYSDYTCDSYTLLGRTYANSVSSGYYPLPNEWVLVTFTTNETESGLFFNGTRVYTGASIFAEAVTESNAYIGNFNPESAYGQDAIYDDARIYNRSLSDEDVAELYAYIPPMPTTTTTIVSINGTIGDGEKISYAVCIDNTTLKNAYVSVAGNETYEKTQIIYCDYGCQRTGNQTAECRPSEKDTIVWFIALFIIIIIIILVILKLGGFR